MDVKLVMFKDAERREFALDRDKTVLGRRQDCDLRIPTRDVSRRHCEIQVSEEGVTVRDLGSTNGTYVNDKRIAEAPLKPGDQLNGGPVVFVVQIDGEPAQIEPPPVSTVQAVTAGGSGAGEEETEEILDLDELDLDAEDPISAVEAMLDEEEDEDEEGP